MQIINGKLLGDDSSKQSEAKTEQHLQILYQNVSEQEHYLQQFEEVIQNIARQVNQNQTALSAIEISNALLAEVKEHLAQLEQRCDRLEDSPQEFVMRSLGNISSEDLQQLKCLVEQQSRRLNYIEVEKISKVQQQLSRLKKQTSPQLCWVAVISFLAIGSLSIFNYYNWRQLNRGLEQKVSLVAVLPTELNFR